MVIHLFSQNKNTWCGAGFNWVESHPTYDPQHSNCRECLKNAAEFGKRAAARLKRI